MHEARVHEEVLELPPAPEGEEILFDYSALGLTLRRHPLALLRPKLDKRGFMTAEQLGATPDGRLVRYCGIVTLRQQPNTARGTVFVSLEDETGVVQVICWKSLRDKQRRDLLQARLLAVHGTWQREGDVTSLIAEPLEDLSKLLGWLTTEWHLPRTATKFSNLNPGPIDQSLVRPSGAGQNDTAAMQDM